MENLFNVSYLMVQNCFMTSIDLSDAYYSVNINESYRKYLRFIWNDKLYQFTCLSNGLTSAPRYFTKLMKPIFSSLRNQGLFSVYYLDDMWLMGRTLEECQLNMTKIYEMLNKAGFLINFEKSQLTLSQNIKFLGFYLDSISMTINLPVGKREKIVSMCSVLVSDSETKHKIRFVATVIGVLISCLPAVPFGALYT